MYASGKEAIGLVFAHAVVAAAFQSAKGGVKGEMAKLGIAVALIILPSAVAARYVDYSEGDDAGALVLILVPLCIYCGYMLGAEAESLRRAWAGAVAIAVLLAITALFVPVGLLTAVAGATTVAGLVGSARRKSN